MHRKETEEKMLSICIKHKTNRIDIKKESSKKLSTLRLGKIVELLTTHVKIHHYQITKSIFNCIVAVITKYIIVILTETI